MTDSASVRRAVAFAVRETGKLDILVNVAASPTVWLCRSAGEDFDRVVSINLKGVMLMMKHSIPYMMENKGGSIVNISSLSAILFRSSDAGDAYCASKGAVLALTGSPAIKYAGTACASTRFFRAPSALR